MALYGSHSGHGQADTGQVTSSPSQQPPTRAEVTSRWQKVARREVSREVVSRWAEPLMFTEFDSQPDVMVMSAVQYLHGFDMTSRSNDGRLVGHGPPGNYLRSLREVAELLDEWVAKCVAFDGDPERWRAERRAAAQAYRRAEQERQAD
jgi:hypothetical protein